MIARRAKLVEVAAVDREGGTTYYARVVSESIDERLVLTPNDFKWAKDALASRARLVLTISEEVVT